MYLNFNDKNSQFLFKAFLPVPIEPIFCWQLLPSSIILTFKISAWLWWDLQSSTYIFAAQSLSTTPLLCLQTVLNQYIWMKTWMWEFCLLLVINIIFCFSIVQISKLMGNFKIDGFSVKDSWKALFGPHPWICGACHCAKIFSPSVAFFYFSFPVCGAHMAVLWRLI